MILQVKVYPTGNTPVTEDVIIRKYLFIKFLLNILI